MAEEDPDDEIVSVVMTEEQRQHLAELVMEVFGASMIQVTRADPDDPDSVAGWMFLPEDADAELIEEMAKTIELLDERGEKVRFTKDQ